MSIGHKAIIVWVHPIPSQFQITNGTLTQKLKKTITFDPQNSLIYYCNQSLLLLGVNFIIV